MKVSDILLAFNSFTYVEIHEPSKENNDDGYILFEGAVCDVPFRLSNLKFEEESEPFEILDNKLVITVEPID